MFVIPFQINDAEYSVFICLQDDNLQRMREYDPAEVQIAKLNFAQRGFHLKDVIVGYATDEDFKSVLEMLNAGNSVEALKLLSRGFRFRPGAGDHDGPYLSGLRGDDPLT